MQTTNLADAGTPGTATGKTSVTIGLPWRRMLAHRGFTFGLVVLASMIAIALLAPWIAPHDPLAQDIMNKRVPPIWYQWFFDDPRASWTHVLGTDKLGRDYLSRLMHGARISLLIGFSTALISGLIGTTLGVAAGYFGGRVDLFISFLITTRLALPVVLVALSIVALHGSSLLIIILVLGFLLWDRFAVVMRSVTHQVRSLEYVTAARAIGCSTTRIVLTEILPNVLSAFIVIATIEMANAILFEAALSFLGLGVAPPAPSWGLMLSESKEDIFFSSWMITIPGTALFILVLAINLLGDGIRDLAAPKGRS
ncbi:ABC transporter permease [Lacisediminimonas profundi]|uniref:ABC transporter permease n=1 Tax=Lacisediminimonas profundi TaxID=2603856 RepID=UPI00124B5157|nr:ABC transporter permease [Lacisediminimonas profundi]